MKRTPCILLISFLLIFDILLILRVKQLENRSILPKEISKYIPFKNSLLSLIVFLSSEGCNLCLEESLVWERIFRDFEREKINIIAFVPTQEDKELIKKSINISFPIMIDEKGKLAKKLKIILNPFRILTNREGKILHMGPPSSRISSQEEYYFEIVEILRKMEMLEFEYKIDKNY